MRILSQDSFNHFVSVVALLLSKEVTDEFTEAVGTIVLHANPDMGYFDPEVIGNKVAKMLANQYAYNALQDIKAKRQAAIKPVDTTEGTTGEQLNLKNQEG